MWKFLLQNRLKKKKKATNSATPCALTRLLESHANKMSARNNGAFCPTSFIVTPAKLALY